MGYSQSAELSCTMKEKAVCSHRRPGAGRGRASAVSARAATSACSPLALDLASSAVISNGPPKTLPCLLDSFGSREMDYPSD
jgi:hypothetical protein